MSLLALIYAAQITVDNNSLPPITFSDLTVELAYSKENNLCNILQASGFYIGKRQRKTQGNGIHVLSRPASERDFITITFSNSKNLMLFYKIWKN
jgi:hypothetical protein